MDSSFTSSVIMSDFQSSAEVILYSPVEDVVVKRSICTFCLRKFNFDGSKSGSGVLLKFLKSMQRYLAGDYDHLQMFQNHDGCDRDDGNVSIGFGACEDCSLLLQDVCDLYDKISVMKMRMNWKLEMLKAIITSADKVPSRRKVLREQGKDEVKNVKKFRNGLVQKTSQKLKAAFPQVRLKKYDDDTKTGQKADLENVEADNSTPEAGNRTMDTDTSEEVLGSKTICQNITVPPGKTFPKVTELVKVNDLDVKTDSRSSPENCKDIKSQDITSLCSPPPSCEEGKPVTFTSSSLSYPLEGNITNDLEISEPFLCKSSQSLEKCQQFSGATSEIVNMETEMSSLVPENDSCDFDDNDTPSPTATFNEEDSEVEVQNVKISNASTSTSQIASAEAAAEFKFWEQNDKPNDHIQAHERKDIGENVSSHDDFVAEQIIQFHPKLKQNENTKNSIEIELSLAHSNPSQNISLHHEVAVAPKCPDPIDDMKTETKFSRAGEKVHDDDHECETAGTVRRRSKRKCTMIKRDYYGRDYNSDGDEGETPAKVRTITVLRHPSRLLRSARTLMVSNSNRTSLMKSLRIEGKFPTLKLLSLEKVLKARFICKVYPCISRVFCNERDFKNHSLYHGTFSCDKCNKMTTYAPYLCDHEVKKHAVRMMNDPQQKYQCPRSRCYYKNREQRRLKWHILTSHMDLPLVKDTCPICCLPVTGELLEHYLEFHDLSNVDYNLIVKCDQGNCLAFFRTSCQRLQHRKIVHRSTAPKTEMKYNCLDCGKQFPFHSNLLKHRKTNHFDRRRNILPCPHRGCTRILSSDVQLSNHVKIHQRKLRYCQACKKMVTVKNWSSHVRCKAHKIGIKNLVLKKEAGTTEDISSSSNSKPVFKKNQFHGQFKCHFCHVTMTDARELLFHEWSHSKKKSEMEKELKCSRCAFSTSSQSQRELVNHFMRSHLKLKAECTICGAEIFVKSGTKNNLNVHIKNNHDLSKKVYRCDEDECTAYFNTRFQLLTHQNLKHLIPEENDELKCKFCGKAWNDVAGLTAHQYNVHLDSFEDSEQLEWRKGEDSSKEFVCEECGRSFQTNLGLLNHVRVHKNKVPKKCICDMCQKDCGSDYKLKLHLLSHSGPDSWEFACEVCGKKCITQQKLDEHKRIHGNEKPFTCEICGTSYAHRHNLRIHINSKHSDVMTDVPKPHKTPSNRLSTKGRKLQQPVLNSSSKRSRKHLRKNNRRRRRRRASSSSSSSSSDAMDDAS